MKIISLSMEIIDRDFSCSRRPHTNRENPIIHCRTYLPGQVQVVSPEVLLIPGTWGNADFWEPFQLKFAEQGITSHAMSLSGHGKSGLNTPLPFVTL